MTAQDSSRFPDVPPIVVMADASTDWFFGAASSARQPHNMIDGVVYASPPPSEDHEDAVYAIEAALKAFQRANGGRVIRVRLDCWLNETTIVQPDTGYVVAERSNLIGSYLRGAPDLAVEVMTPGSRQFDNEAKFDAYGRHGVREAWFVDLETKQITVVNGDGGAWSSERVVKFGEDVPSQIVSVGDANLTSD
ncbi:MAG: Uma2 family endonuclease [Dehalococcoidia bacterium]